MHLEKRKKMKLNPLEDVQGAILGMAYGHSTLGMPLNGIESNLEELNSGIFNDFFQEYALPSRIIYCASGIKDHNQFMNLVDKATSRIPPLSAFGNARTKSQYKGGEARMFYDVPSVSLSLCFESVPIGHFNMPAFGILKEILENKGFSKNTGIKQKFPFVESVDTINMNFSDSGLFGLTVKGAKGNAKDLSKVLIETLLDLKRGITDKELQEAKDRLKANINKTMQEQDTRLEEVVKNVSCI